MQECDGPGEAGQIHQAVLAEHQRRAQEANRDRSILRRGKAQQLAPAFLLEGVERRQDRAEHGNGDDEDAGDRDRQRVIDRQPLDRPRLSAKNAAFRTTPDRSAPVAPLPAP